MAGVLCSHTCKIVGVYTGGVGMEAVERLEQPPLLAVAFTVLLLSSFCLPHC